MKYIEVSRSDVRALKRRKEFLVLRIREKAKDKNDLSFDRAERRALETALKVIEEFMLWHGR